MILLLHWFIFPPKCRDHNFSRYDNATGDFSYSKDCSSKWWYASGHNNMKALRTGDSEIASSVVDEVLGLFVSYIKIFSLVIWLLIWVFVSGFHDKGLLAYRKYFNRIHPSERQHHVWSPFHVWSWIHGMGHRLLCRIFGLGLLYVARCCIFTTCFCKRNAHV